MPPKDLNQELFDEPFRFNFFQAVRILERMYPDRAPVARGVIPQDEVVRFRSQVSLNFPPSEIHSLNEVDDEISMKRKLEMFVNFMGMAGISGILPTHYTELIIERARYGDTSLWAFLDIFNHRMISMFYRAWEKYRFPIQYERGNDDFTAFLFDFAGLGTRGLRGQMDLEDESLLPYVGLIAQKPHSASTLKNILSDYFRIKARVMQFSGQWIELDKESITVVGQANSLLGVNTVVGTKVWDYQSKFRVVLEALAFKEFQAFLPNGTAFKPLLSIIKFMSGDELDFDVQLKLRAKEVPSCILTTRAKRRPMLGWTSWLKTKPFKKDDDQLIVQV